MANMTPMAVYQGSKGMKRSAAGRRVGKGRKAGATIIGGNKRPRVTQTAFGGDDLAV